jgi:ferredoxin/flavodoxin---NADP+ reductase
MDNISNDCYKKNMLNATVIKRIDVTPDLLIIHVKPDAGVPDFLAGQYVALALDASHVGISGKPKLIKRAYSIGSSPSEKEYLEFYIAIVKDGELTPLLANLREGDRMHVAPKITGTFTLKEVPNGSNLIFVSTGTGIAPYMAMLRTKETWTNYQSMVLVHGVRYETDLAYADELRGFQDQFSRFRYFPIVSRASEAWSGDRGHLQKLFTEGKINLQAQKDHVFLCGNPAMIEDMEKYLAALGYVEHTRKQPGTLHLEKYW